MQSFLLRRGATYSYRVRVPRDLVPLLGGRRELKKALGTACPVTAKSRAAVIHAAVQTLIARLRMTSLPADAEAFLEFMKRATEWSEAMLIEHLDHLPPDQQAEFRHHAATIRTALAGARAHVKVAELEEVNRGLQRALARGAGPGVPAEEISVIVERMEAIAAQATPDPFKGLDDKAKLPISNFLDAFLAKKRLSRSSVYNYKRCFRMLTECLGNKSVGLIDTRDLQKFHELLMDTPSDKGDGNFLKHDTIYRYISNVSCFFDEFAIPNHLANDNPTRRVVVLPDKDSDSDEDNPSRRPYTIDELTIIFDAPLYRGCKSERRIDEPGEFILRNHKTYFPLVALFSGMRLSEIAQLEFDDIVEHNGRPHFSVNRKSLHGHKKTTKTESSIRFVPIHKELERCGFFDYIKRRESEPNVGRIFPDYRYSNWWNQVFLVRRGLKEDALVFHSFRHTFRDALREATESDESVDRILGHHHDGTGPRYGDKRKRLHRESEVIETVAYPGLDLSHLRQ
ncbi:tyrosine-type recombinase/integrase [Azospirillum sp. RWY-5-1]|uniref:Tyrosine-type recombinase/integrase n=1 Tax=Azospirillum oleiclasticum TaxID=2735135 RepID=A0ABX2THZ7_9PROT|nr:DUF6538 domain-containing protein [Azospirillum oleiclasticum]NYZ15030.1 tyrosine-type recombinase/integrase [Azospirillum oleiclasticum]NYZ22792.1 tyrosine-type recombinase/integrase [Azospirillum oleiclasticum]